MGEFLDKTIRLDAVEHRYAVYVPHDYQENRPTVLVFLHGEGGCGTDGRRQLDTGLGPAIRAEPERWPLLVVFPQKPDAASEWVAHAAMVTSMLEATRREYTPHWLRFRHRHLLTGISQGGTGALALAAAQPDTWEAIAPVSAAPDPSTTPFVRAGIWAFHGAEDRVVPVQSVKDWCAASNAARGHAVLTVFERADHDAWDLAYRSDLPEWFRLHASGDFALAYVLREPAKASLNSLEITWFDEAGIVEGVSIGAGHLGWRREWIRNEVRKAEEVAAGVASTCLAECVRVFARCGIGEADSVWQGEFRNVVKIDYCYGTGGRSCSGWPKGWRIPDADPRIVVGLRRMTDLMKAVR